MIKTLDDVKKEFLPVPAKELTEPMKARITRLELAFVNMGHEMIDLVPDSAHRTSAFRKLIEAKFTCVQAITHVATVTKEMKPDNFHQGAKNAEATKAPQKN